MSGFRFFKLHRPWEDWFGMLLGVLIVVSPWFPMQASHEAVDAERSAMILNTFVVGMLVFGLAQLEYVALQRWEEVGEIVLGLLADRLTLRLRLFRRCQAPDLACGSLAGSSSSWARCSSGRIGT